MTLLRACRHFALLAATLLAAAVAQAQAQPAATVQGTVQEFTLRNGMTLLVREDHRAAIAINMLWLRVGSIDEVDGSSGVAHVLEHMLFKGTPTVPAGEFSKRIAAMGGQDNASTFYDYTNYYQKVPAARLREAMALDADRFINLSFRSEDFAKELEVVKEERRMRTEDNPHAGFYEMQQAQVFTASPYRRPIVGWMGDLEAMQAEDARNFFRTWYTPRNAALVVVGDVKASQVYAWAEELYGKWPAHALPQRKPQPEPAQNGLRRMNFKAVAEQAVVSLTFKIPSLTEQKIHLADATSSSSATAQDIYALIMLAEVLDGYEGARLARALTQGEGRVADSARAGIGVFGRGPETFVLQGVPAQGQTPAALEAALRAQITRIAQEGVSAAELKRVKNQYAASEIFKRDSLMEQARELGNYWVVGQPLNASELLIARLQSVTPAQVQEVAKRYFGDDNLTVATLIPQPPQAGAAKRRSPAPSGAARH